METEFTPPATQVHATQAPKRHRWRRISVLICALPVFVLGAYLVLPRIDVLPSSVPNETNPNDPSFRVANNTLFPAYDVEVIFRRESVSAEGRSQSVNEHLCFEKVGKLRRKEFREIRCPVPNEDFPIGNTTARIITQHKFLPFVPWKLKKEYRFSPVVKDGEKTRWAPLPSAAD